MFIFSSYSFLFNTKYLTNELLYKKKLEPSFAVNYGLDFSKLNKGKYDAVLAGNNNFYKYEVTVE